jgi:hypothetical protein
VKSAEEIMNILEAYDLTGSLRDAGELAGCSHHTVARYVRARGEGRLVPGAPSPRPGVIDEFLPKLEELVERSKGRVRADVAHEKITAMGFAGSERTTRRAVARLKKAWHSGRRRVFRPWIPEPGMWAQYDFGDGPRVNGAATVLFCLWLAWSMFRVVLPILDKTQASVWAAVDVALRRAGGVPAYLLTDNEKTVTVEHVAGMPVRNPGAVEFGRHYGLTVATCVPYDPASKGGSESTVKLAKADLVPTAANLLGEYGSFAALEAACALFCEQVNARPHRVTRRAPAEMLADERPRLHPGSPRLDEAHYPPAPPGALNREPKPRTAAEAEFLAIGDGAGLWLAEAAAAGASRVRSKMTRAVQLAALHGTEPVDRALGQAAAAGRFADGDLAALLAHQASAAPGEATRAGESRTLAQGTGSWAPRDGGKEEGQ